eukprot:tig00020903_g15094.t1
MRLRAGGTPHANAMAAADLNLPVLQRLDPSIDRILSKAGHVVIYFFSDSAKQWQRQDVEGPIFVVQRTSEPAHRLVVMNRLSTTNFTEDISTGFETQESSDFLLYKNRSGQIHGIWFYNAAERKAVTELLQQLSRDLAAGRPSDNGGLASNVLKLFQAADSIPEQHIPRAPTASNQAGRSILDILQNPGAASVPSAPPAPPAPAQAADLERSFFPPAPEKAPAEASSLPLLSPTALLGTITSQLSISKKEPVKLTRDQLKDTLIRLVSDDAFLDHVWQELSKPQH